MPKRFIRSWIFIIILCASVPFNWSDRSVFDVYKSSYMITAREEWECLKKRKYEQTKQIQWMPRKTLFAVEDKEESFCITVFCVYCARGQFLMYDFVRSLNFDMWLCVWLFAALPLSYFFCYRSVLVLFFFSKHKSGARSKCASMCRTY